MQKLAILAHTISGKVGHFKVFHNLALKPSDNSSYQANKMR